MSKEMKLSISAIVLTMLTSITTLVVTNCSDGKNGNTTPSVLETPCVTACSTAANLGCKVLCSKVFGASVTNANKSLKVAENAGCAEETVTTEATKTKETILTMCQGKECVKIDIDTKDASPVN